MDLAFCRERRVDVLFAPDVQEIYPQRQRAHVDVEGISEHLCGRFRPGHFRGVATILLKLFNIVCPHRAYFGEKDAQQLALVRRMVLDLNLPIDIIALGTVREEDGLALSSRNRYLSAGQRQAAAALYRALKAAAIRVAEGATDAGEVQAEALAILQQEPQVHVEYLEVVDPDEMQPVDRIAGPVRIAGAIRVGETRLIDNLLVLGESEQP
jgi:pantoate--beta-alanine ligase